jgi:hypothetical protein
MCQSSMDDIPTGEQQEDDVHSSTSHPAAEGDED